MPSASVPYNPVPSVAPEVGQPNDYLNVRANPNAFGASIGQAVQGLGQAGEKVAHEAEGLAQFWGQIQTDDAINGTMKRANGVIEQYRTLRGQDALNAQAPTNEALDSIFTEGRQGLAPVQQYQYDQTTRMYRERYLAGIVSSHAATQGYAYASKVNGDALTLALNSVATGADDPTTVETFRHDAREALVKQVSVEGNGSDPKAVEAAIAHADQAVYKTQIQTVAARDPVTALSLIETHRAALGADYAPLLAHVQPQAIRVQASSVADTYLRRAGIEPTPAGPVLRPATLDLSAISQALLGQESAGNDAVPPSVDGARGPMQIKPGTFAQYAQAGEAIDNPADNRAVGQRIIADLAKRFDNDPARVAVGYFSGPGNVAPPGSPTPWKKDLTDGNGKSVSSYVTDISSRLTKAGLLSDKAAALAQIDKDYAGNPQMAAAVRSHVVEQYSIASAMQQAQALQQAQARTDASTEYARAALDPKSDPQALVEKLRQDSRLSAPDIENLVGFIGRQGKSVDPNAGTYGPAFTQTFQNANAPAGDPSRLDNPAELLPLMADGRLTYSGYTTIKGFIDDRNNPGGNGTAALHKSLMDVAGKTINPKEFFGLPGDPQGARNLASFQDAYVTAYKAGIKAGYAPEEMLTPSGKHSLYPLMDQFKPKVAEAINDGAPDLSAFDLKASAGIQAAYKAHAFAKDDLENYQKAKLAWQAASLPLAVEEVPRR